MIGVGDALFAGGRRGVAGLKVERRGDAAERAVAPRATNGVVVVGGSDEGIRLDGFCFGEVLAIMVSMSHHAFIGNPARGVSIPHLLVFPPANP